MSNPTRTYHFAIDGLSPRTLPMARLAEYIADLASLLGQPEHVHFDRVSEGSAILVHEVDEAAVPAVEQRLGAVGRDDAPADVAKAFRTMNERLAKDQARASLREPGGAEIIPFPGVEQTPGLTYGPFRERGSLDGVLIRVGGKDDTVPVHLLDGDKVHICNANREVARLLAPSLFGPILRVHGEGRWERDQEGKWNLLRFDIRDFEPLDDVPLGEAVRRLRAVKGSGWQRISEPARELHRLRGGHGEND